MTVSNSKISPTTKQKQKKRNFITVRLGQLLGHSFKLIKNILKINIICMDVSTHMQKVIVRFFMPDYYHKKYYEYMLP